MSKRKPQQVLIIPFHKNQSNIEYFILKRSDTSIYQWVSGGVEGDELLTHTAKRELEEELDIKLLDNLMMLETCTSIPANNFREYKREWDVDILLVKEYSFAIEIGCKEGISLPEEYINGLWASYNEALRLLKWDSNKTALWELNEKLMNSKL